MLFKDLFERLIGEWEGVCSSWFEPGKLADKSKIAGKIEWVFKKNFVRHTYESKILGKPRIGEELIAFNSITKKLQCSWIDNFHMNYAIMFLEGNFIDSGFNLSGKYDVANDQPCWGWKTLFKLMGNDKLIITSYNITPNGEEAKAIETIYQRIGI